MNRFLVTSEKFTGTVELLFNEKGTLCKIDMTQAALNEDAVVAFKRAAPHNLHTLMKNEWCGKETTVIQGDFVVSFEMFWTDYRNKINKKRCIPLWEKLSKPKQVAAYYGISRYDKFLHKNSWRTKADPENYLRNEMWENEYK